MENNCTLFAFKMQSAFSGDLSFFTTSTDIISEIGKDYHLLSDALVIIGTPDNNVSIPAENTLASEDQLTVRLVFKQYNDFGNEDRILYTVQLIFSNPPRVYENVIRVVRVFSQQFPTTAANVVTDIEVASGNFNEIPQIYRLRSPNPQTTVLTDFSFQNVENGNVPLDIKKVIGHLEISKLYSVKDFLKLRYDYAGTTTKIEESLENQTPLLGKCNQEGILTINYTTDSFGGNLAEIIIAIADDKFYPHSFPHNLVARNKGIHVLDREDDKLFTFYAKRPKVVLTLLEDGEYDLQRVVKIKQVFGITESLYNFYNNIMTYASLKYGLAGLITGKFSIKWLYAKNNAKFFKLLAGSDFASTIVFFEPFVGYVQYFRWSK